MSSWNAYWQPDEDSDGDELGEDIDAEFRLPERDCVLFMVDASPSMMTAPEPEDGEEEEDEQKTPFAAALEYIGNFAKDKIITSDKDIMGVCFFSTRESKSNFHFDNIFVYQDLDQPSAKRIQDIEQMCEDPSIFEGQIGSSNKDSYPFFEALWTALQLFSEVRGKFGFKRLIILTNEEDPSAGSSDAINRAKERAADLLDSDVTSIVVAIRRNHVPLDPEPFWKWVLNPKNERLTLDEMGFQDFDAQAEEHMTLLRRRNIKKRSGGKLPLLIGEDGEIGFKLYNLCMSAKKAPPFWIHADSNTQLKSERKLICQATGSELHPSTDLAFSHPFGTDYVVFDSDEIKEIKQFSIKPSLRLMGFKDAKAVKPHYNIRHSSFLYPDEESVRGSTVASVALHRSLLRKGKVAICRMVPRRGAQPRFVALVPQPEVIEDGAVVVPNGFHAVPLPFRDDIRDLQFSEPRPAADSDAVLMAKGVISELTYPVSALSIANPALQHHYNCLQAMALHQPLPEKEDDAVMNKETLEVDEIREALDRFERHVIPHGYSADEVTGAAKSRTAAGGARASKLAKAGSDGQSVDSYDWMDLLRTGQLSSLNIPTLKLYLEAHSLSKAGRKADLVTRIEEHLSRSGAAPASSSSSSS